jgi:hypothetical protein
MRKKDKYKVILEANQKLEEKYLKDKGLVNKSWVYDEKYFPQLKDTEIVNDNIKQFENFEQINESISSDILYVAAIVFGSLFGLSLTATAIVLIKSKLMRTMFKELFSNIPKMIKIRNKIKKSENYKELMKMTKDFNINPTEDKKKQIMGGLKNILDSEEIAEVEELINKSNNKIRQFKKEKK